MMTMRLGLFWSYTDCDANPFQRSRRRKCKRHWHASGRCSRSGVRIELAKANEALRGCLDALAAVPNLDEFLGQVMAAITRELRGTSSILRLRNFETNCLTVELVFQDGRVMNPAEAKYPEWFQSIPLDQRQLGLLKRPSCRDTPYRQDFTAS